MRLIKIAFGVNFWDTHNTSLGSIPSNKHIETFPASDARRINENKFMSFPQPSLSCLRSLAGRNKSFIAARIQESAFSPEFRCYYQ